MAYGDPRLGKKTEPRRVNELEGANPASFFTNGKRNVCDICEKKKDIKKLVIIHNQWEHLFICKTCKIPQGFNACGCGG